MNTEFILNNQIPYLLFDKKLANTVPFSPLHQNTFTMDPTGPSQPPKATAYETEGVGIDSTPQELHSARSHTHGAAVEQRIPTSQSSGIEEATPTSVARGIRGAPPGEEQYGRTEEQVGRHRELDGEQMRAPGEGNVADVVNRKPGATGSEPDLASDLDRYVFPPPSDVL